MTDLAEDDHPLEVRLAQHAGEDPVVFEEEAEGRMR